MPELTKKRPTEASEEQISLTLTGPRSELKAALRAVEPLGFHNQEDELVSWRSAFADLEHLPDWSISLQGARGKENLTQSQLSELTNIPQRHISEMENGKRPIGKERAKRLAAALNIDYRVLL
jgi:ribosome-binding protein aMBF1 (putative translation factor)